MMTEHKDTIYTVVANDRLTRRTWRMTLEGPTHMLTRPGQFVNLAIEGKFLRRPISVSDYAEGSVTLLYDAVGEGTEAMTTWRSGKKVDMLNGLGNGFDTTCGCRRPLLIGGGIGVAPMVGLARDLIYKGARPMALLGFASSADVVAEEELIMLGVETRIATVDGSAGVKGFVTDLADGLPEDTDYFYACGPLPMLKAVCSVFDLPGQISMESRMGCGFGACVCCSIELKSGTARICKEGPVFRKEELIWK